MIVSLSAPGFGSRPRTCCCSRPSSTRPTSRPLVRPSHWKVHQALGSKPARQSTVDRRSRKCGAKKGSTCSSNHTPGVCGYPTNAMMRDYYVQRASAGLILSEATSVAPAGGTRPGPVDRLRVKGAKKMRLGTSRSPIFRGSNRFGIEFNLRLECARDSANKARGDGDEAKAAASRTLVVPPSLQASLMARLDRLGPAKEVAQIAAAIGRESPHALLALVAEETESDLVASLKRLVRAGLLFRQGRPPEGRIRGRCPRGAATLFLRLERRCAGRGVACGQAGRRPSPAARPRSGSLPGLAHRCRHRLLCRRVRAVRV